MSESPDVQQMLLMSKLRDAIRLKSAWRETRSHDDNDCKRRHSTKNNNIHNDKVLFKNCQTCSIKDVRLKLAHINKTVQEQNELITGLKDKYLKSINE